MDKVMIIDDEIWVTEVIRNIIDWKKFGFEIVSVCHDGEEAMSVIREIQPADKEHWETAAQLYHQKRADWQKQQK